MTRPTRTDPAGRAYLDLQNQARRQRRGTQELLTLYVLERFLARLSTSSHADRFVLKGGMLLAALSARRPTADLDLMATHLANDEQTVLNRIIEIAAITPETDDGVTYRTETARARTIRESDLYTGVRISMEAGIHSASVKLALDINFGDPITPAPELIDYPALLPGMAPVRILGYPIHTVLAEKITTAVNLGATSTRVRDYLDIWTLTGIHDLDAAPTRAALDATATYRQITLRPLSQAITDLAATRAETYAAFLRRLGPDAEPCPRDFRVVVDQVVAFADPLLAPHHHDGHWSAARRAWTTGLP